MVGKIEVKVRPITDGVLPVQWFSTLDYTLEASTTS